MREDQHREKKYLLEKVKSETEKKDQVEESDEAEKDRRGDGLLPQAVKWRSCSISTSSGLLATNIISVWCFTCYS